jgi:hypothetical protein
VSRVELERENMKVKKLAIIVNGILYASGIAALTAIMYTAVKVR